MDQDAVISKTKDKILTNCYINRLYQFTLPQTEWLHCCWCTLGHILHITSLKCSIIPGEMMCIWDRAFHRYVVWMWTAYFDRVLPIRLVVFLHVLLMCHRTKLPMKHTYYKYSLSSFFNFVLFLYYAYCLNFYISHTYHLYPLGPQDLSL